MQNKEIYNNAQQLKQMKSTAMDANTDTGRSPSICYHHPCLIYQSINQYDGKYWSMRSNSDGTITAAQYNAADPVSYLTQVPYLLITLEERDTTSWRR